MTKPIDFSVADVAVIGDYITDEYYYCHASRISPEAPIPVCVFDSSEIRPGGAGNVAVGLRALSAGKVSEVAPDVGIHKTRIVVGKHQIARIDLEPDPDVLHKMWNPRHVQAVVGICHTTVISDYGRMPEHIIREAIAGAKRAGRTVIVDPKRPGDVYQGADLITPNAMEWDRMGRQSYGADVLITRGEEGMTLITRDNDVIQFPAMARDVSDVTGAGDTVVATVAAAISAGYSLTKAVELANIAAGIAVEHFGTYAVSIEELRGRVNAI